MPTYRVDFDYTEYAEEVVGSDPDTGDDVYEDVVEDYSGSIYVDADSEEEAREIAEDELSWDYNDVSIWNIEED